MLRFYTVLSLILSIAGNTVLHAQPCNSQSINLLQTSRDFGYGIPNVQDPPNYLAPAPYIFSSVAPPAQGEYTLTNNTSGWGAPGLIGTPDNSITPIGYMMVVNSQTNPGAFFA